MKNNEKQNANFDKTLIYRMRGEECYEVENYEGMTDEEIINACDDCHFGGRVVGNRVIVYTD